MSDVSTNTVRPGIPTDANKLLGDILHARNWEAREGQIRMVGHIAGPDNNGTPYTATAAPVATGKTLGYLCGALPWARRIIIATSTKALQTQIIEKELPELRDNLRDLYGYELTFMALKGKSNYLDMGKTARLLSSHNGEVAVTDDDDVTLDLIEADDDDEPSDREWDILAEAFDKTQQGMDNLDLTNLDQDEMIASLPRSLRQKVVVDRYSKETSRKWPTANQDDTYLKVIEKSKCAYRTAYASAMNVDVLVINTPLLAAEVVKSLSPIVATDAPRLLPETDLIVIDEAHHATVKFIEAMQVVHDVYDFRKQSTRYLNKMEKAGLRGELKSSMVKHIEEYAQRMVDLCDNGQLTRAVLASTASGLMDEMVEFHAAAKGDAQKSLSTMLDIFHHEFARELGEVASTARQRNSDGDTTHMIASNWRSSTVNYQISFADDTPIISLTPIDLTAVSDAMVQTTRDLQRYVHAPELHLGELDTLKGRGYIAMCSGTIAREATTDIGITSASYQEVPSPLSPHAQKFYLPRYLPNPSGGKQQVESFREESWKEAAQGIRAIGGRTLFLCTSFRALEYYYAEAQREFGGEFTLLSQGGNANKQELIERFKAQEQSILFGTLASFGEGVDVPGSALSLVIIDKINFPVPDQPVHRSRVEDARRKGKNDFEVSINAAAVMMAQGAGRLLRSQACIGGVMVLDPRIASKRYGKKVMRLIPQDSEWTDELPLFTGYLAEVRKSIETGKPTPAVSLAGRWKPLRNLGAKK